MKLGRHCNLLPLLLVLLALEAQASWFDGKGKKNKQDKSSKSVPEDVHQADKQTNGGGNCDAEAVELAKQLAAMEDPQPDFEARKKNDISSLLAAIQEQDRFSNFFSPKRADRNKKESLKDQNDGRQTEHEDPLEEQEQQEKYVPRIRKPKLSKKIEQVNKDGTSYYVSSKVDSPDALDKTSLVPEIDYKQMRHDPKSKPNSSSRTSSSWMKSMKAAYRSTKNSLKPVAGAIIELPKYMSQATDSISAFLKLDSRGRLLAMIEQVDEEIQFLRREFSSFSLSWSPIMEKALNYIGSKNLNKLEWASRDELDFRQDALYLVAFGYEFMRLMIGWRENLIVAHEAYKLYLERIKMDLASGNKELTVNEDLMFHLNTIHNYMLLSSWFEIDSLLLEPRMKLDYLMAHHDDQEKNYEREYFRLAIVFQELYEPVISEFEREKREVSDALSLAGAQGESLEDVDAFFLQFREALAKNQIKDIDWEIPEPLAEFMRELKPEIQYNPLVYRKSFLKELKSAKEAAKEAVA